MFDLDNFRKLLSEQPPEHTCKDARSLSQIYHDNQKHQMRTKDINVADILTFEDRQAIANIVDQRVAKEYGDMFPFNWSMNISGHFICN
tara:strand:- start:573 stop:839 length:267 start_codon:yes stop_codon:yes gene_type:complete